MLRLLSLLFGKALRRAASACVSAAQRTQTALRRASGWLSGHRSDDDVGPVQVRVITEGGRVRVAAESDEDVDEHGAEEEHLLRRRVVDDRK